MCVDLLAPNSCGNLFLSTLVQKHMTDYHVVHAGEKAGGGHTLKP
jgi:hypothetical protein